MKTIYNGIFKENPTFILVLGLCPALAVTKTVESAYMMGFSVLFVLILSNFIISLIKKLVPDSVQIPVYILIIGTLVTVLELLLGKYVPKLSNTLGVYLSLITVNCIVLGRSLSVASKKSVGTSILDAIGIGVGFTLSLTLIALIREVIGTNSITIMNDMSLLTGYRLIFKNVLPVASIYPISFFIKPAGAFLVLGLLLAFFNYIKGESK